MEKPAGPDWEDTCFFGIYATLEKLGELGEDEAARRVTGQLPTILEGQTRAYQNQSAPKSSHERGTWHPEESVKDPYPWTPVLDPIAKGAEESEGTPDSFKSAMEGWDVAWEKQESQDQGKA